MNAQEMMDMIERRAELRGEMRGVLRDVLRDLLHGELQGRRKAVLRLLRRKFGVLPDDIVARVQDADAPLLEQLEDKVLFAKSLEEVFPS